MERERERERAEKREKREEEVGGSFITSRVGVLESALSSSLCFCRRGVFVTPSAKPERRESTRAFHGSMSRTLAASTILTPPPW